MRRLRRARGALGLAAVTACVVAVGVAPADGASAVAVYRGPLGPGSRHFMQVDVRGAHARVFFLVRCSGSIHHFAFEANTIPPGADGPAYAPVPALVHGGRLTVNAKGREPGELEPGESPEAHIHVHAHVTPSEITGVFSLSVFEPGNEGFEEDAGGIEGLGEQHCSSGTLRFVLKRGSIRHGHFYREGDA